jgi:hypothetical protein
MSSGFVTQHNPTVQLSICLQNEGFYFLGYNAVQSGESQKLCLLPAPGWFLALLPVTVKMGATCSSETSVDLHRTTRLYIREDIILHCHRRENLKFNIVKKNCLNLWTVDYRQKRHYIQHNKINDMNFLLFFQSSAFPLLPCPFLAYFPYLKNERGLMRSPCCLAVCVSVRVYLSVYPFVSVHLSVHPPLMFVRRIMRSPCCLCACVSPPPLLFVRRLMRSCSLCLCPPYCC